MKSLPLIFVLLSVCVASTFAIRNPNPRREEDPGQLIECYQQCYVKHEKPGQQYECLEKCHKQDEPRRDRRSHYNNHRGLIASMINSRGDRSECIDDCQYQEGEREYFKCVAECYVPKEQNRETNQRREREQEQEQSPELTACFEKCQRQEGRREQQLDCVEGCYKRERRWRRSNDEDEIVEIEYRYERDQPLRRFEECQRKCEERQGQSDYECQQVCKQQYRRQRGQRGGRQGRRGEQYEDEDEELDNRSRDPQKHFDECQQSCQQQEGGYRCQTECQRQYQQEQQQQRRQGGQYEDEDVEDRRRRRHPSERLQQCQEECRQQQRGYRCQTECKREYQREQDRRQGRRGGQYDTNMSIRPTLLASFLELTGLF